MSQNTGRLWEEREREEAGERSLERSESDLSPAGPICGEGSGESLPADVNEDSEGPPSLRAESETDALEAETDPTTWEPDPAPPRLVARRRGTLSKGKKPQRPRLPLSPQQKLLLLDTWQRSGLPARDFGALVDISRHTLYAWKRRFEREGPAGLMEKPRGPGRGSRLSEIAKRAILMLKQAHPDWGCQRISDVLARGPALGTSPGAIARVLRESGYETQEQPTQRHPDKVRRFEREQPNQLWQTDLFTFVLKRQNRRVYLVAFMDDHSRFITGYGLHASQSSALVLEVLRAAMASYRSPTEILTDNGSQYVTWRGKSQFTKELEKRGIKQIVARPRRPQTLGKIERFWGTLWRECIEASVFIDLADARQRIGLFIDYYNFQRPHQGIDGLVPADRFFEAAPEVLNTMRERIADNALELARHGIPKKPFYLTGQLDGKAFSVHREGDRVMLRQAGEQAEEIDLITPPPSTAEDSEEGAHQSDSLPAPQCPDGSPQTAWNPPDAVLLPGASPVDAWSPKLKAPESDSHEQDGPPSREDEPATDADEGGLS